MILLIVNLMVILCDILKDFSGENKIEFISILNLKNGCNTTGCNTTGCNTTDCNTIGCNTTGCNTIGCNNWLQYDWL